MPEQPAAAGGGCCRRMSDAAGARRASEDAGAGGGCCCCCAHITVRMADLLAECGGAGASGGAYDPVQNPNELLELCRCDCADCKCNSADVLAKASRRTLLTFGGRGGARERGS